MINNLLVADTTAQIRYFAVGIRKYPRHTHAGVLYVHPTEGGLHLLHLGEPGQLKREPWNPEWGWAGLGILKREELFQLSVLCQHAFETKEDMPYGFRYSDATRFLTDGRLHVAQDHKGLTCSTFVLALLACFDILLLDLNSWPVRPEDGHIVNCLATVQNDPAVAAEFPCARYRPEEVVAACAVNALKVPYATAEPLGHRIVEKMDGYLNRKRSGV